MAVAVAHDLLEGFAGAVLFVDLGALMDADLAATSLASMLGLSVQSEDPVPGLIAYLRDKRILLIFDNCEHIIEAVASLAVRIFLAAPQVHILATSREASGSKVSGSTDCRRSPFRRTIRGSPRQSRSPSRDPVVRGARGSERRPPGPQ